MEVTRSFGLDAPSALGALKDAVKRLEDDEINKDLARDCAIKAWQLCDHAFKALGPNPPFKRLREFQDSVKQTCPELAYLQDICTESKHGEITRWSPRIDAARFHEGGFSYRDFSHDFDISRLEVDLPDGRTLLFQDVVARAVGFWTNFFDDYGIK